MKKIVKVIAILSIIIPLFYLTFTGCSNFPTYFAKPTSTSTPTPTPSATAAGEEKIINVVFRYDDYSAVSDINIALRIIDIFRQNKAAITFSVIPFRIAGNVHNPSPQDVIPLSAEKGEILKAGVNEGVLDVALHGYSHQTINAKQDSEFSGLDYNSQLEKLTKGRQFLESMIDAPVTLFVPPWDSYDLNTLRALQELGFSTISANIHGVVTEDSKLNFLPDTCSLTVIKQAIQATRASSDPQPVIVVVFHQYDFKEINTRLGITTIQEFSDTVSWLKSQEDIRILSISQAVKSMNDLSSHHFLLWKQLAKLNSPLYYPSASILGEEEYKIMKNDLAAKRSELHFR